MKRTTFHVIQFNSIQMCFVFTCGNSIAHVITYERL